MAEAIAEKLVRPTQAGDHGQRPVHIETCSIRTGGKFDEFAERLVLVMEKQAIPPADKKNPAEQTVKEVSQQFGVSPSVVYYWIVNKTIAARRLNHGSPYWITISPQKKRELEKWVRESNRSRPH